MAVRLYVWKILKGQIGKQSPVGVLYKNITNRKYIDNGFCIQKQH
jgi:hypothetical protein